MSTKSQFPVLLGVQIKESENTCEISADIRGFYANDVNVTAWQDSLIIEMTTQHEPSQSYYLGELEPESYRRVIPLGFAVDSKSLMTHYNNGALEILVHKSVAADQPVTQATH